MVWSPRKEKPNEPVTITPGKVPGVVGKDQVADEAITTEKIRDATIRSEDIGPGQVQTPNIADNAITEPKITAGAVTETKIGDGQVTESKLAEDSVDNRHINDGAVTTPKIAAGAVTLSKLGSDVGATPLGDNAVTETKILDGAVTKNKLGSHAVGAGKIEAGAVGTAELAVNAVIAIKILDSNVTVPKLNSIAYPNNNDVASYDAGTGKIKWIVPSPGLVRYAEVEISSYQIKNIEYHLALVVNSDPSKLLQFVSMTIFYDAGSIPYTVNANDIKVFYEDIIDNPNLAAVLSETGFYDDLVDKVVVRNAIDFGPIDPILYVGMPLMLGTAAGSPTDGDGVLHIKVAYMIHDTGL